MDESDRRLFQKIYLRFVDRVDSIDMLGYITCLSKHTRDTITNSQTCHNGSTSFAAQKLFDALKSRPDGLQQAAYALLKCGHDDLANEIERQQASAQHHFHETQRFNSPPVPSVHNSSSNGANSVSMSEYHNYPQDDQALRNFVGKEPSMEPEPLKIYGSQNKCSVIEQENELNKSDTENEDSYTDFTVKKNIEVEENISSVPDSDSSKVIYHQDNTEFMPTLTNNEVSIEKPERFRMVNKSPITDDEHEDASNAEDPEVSTETVAIVEPTKQPIDHSLEDARIPLMMFRQDNSELNSIMRKKDKASIFEIYSYNRENESEDGIVSNMEEGVSVGNSDVNIILTDAIPTTVAANSNGMNEYIEQDNNPIRSIQCPPLFNSAQSAGDGRVLDDIGQRPEAAEYIRLGLTSWVSFGSSLLSSIFMSFTDLFPDG